MLITPTRVAIRQDGKEVVVIKDGKVIMQGHHSKIMAVARGMINKCKQAEEYEQWDRVSSDQAICTRLGLPFGIATQPKVMDEAMKKAAWDSKLRKQLRPMQGVAAKTKVYAPTIVQHPPRGDQK